MNVIEIVVGELGCSDETLLLGYAGEDSVEAVVFDFSPWAVAYGPGTITLEIMRASDTAPYTPLLTIDGTTARWTISDVDTARRGPGIAQLVFTPEGKTKKSAVFKFFVGKSIRSDDDPDPWQDLLDRLEELLGEMQQEAADTRENAAAADQSAQDAAASESNAEAWAVGERGGEPVPETDPTYENNAKHYAGLASASETEAKEAADAADQSAGEAAESSQESADYASAADQSARDALGYASDAEAQAQLATDKAEESAGHAQEAEGYSEDSEAWAVGKRGGVDVPQDDPAYNNNALFYARAAEDGAKTSGYAWFDVDNEDGLLYVTFTSNQDTDVNFALDTNTGELEVVFT